MCGLVAAISLDKPIDSSNFQSALQSITHRGPDEHGAWFSPDKKQALAHTRLSIMDLAHGHQPLHSMDESIVAVVNGELYDFERIRASLIERGHIFKTKSDSEIIIPLYQEFGLSFVEHLRGEFAFVLWDKNQQKVIAGRDRFGIKPLYYTVYQNSLYLASEIKALFALGVPCQWDKHTVYALEHLLYSQEDTLFHDIKAIKPGHFICFNEGDLQQHQYWDFDYIKANELPETYSEQNYIEGFQYHFSEAVRLRMRSDVPVANYLSGGLDSCCVLAQMMEHAQQPVDAFTLSFDEDAAYDEAAQAKEMAALAGSQHHLIPVRQKDMCQYFEQSIWHNETAIFNNNTVAKYILSDHVQKAGYKVVLTGEGADEIAAGYPPFRQDLILYNSHGQDPKVIQSMLRKLRDSNQISQGLLVSDQTVTEHEYIKKKLGFVPSILSMCSLRGQALQKLSKTEHMQTEFDPMKAFIDSLDMLQLSGCEAVTQSQYVWSKSILPGLILTLLGDRMEMAHSLEGRVPFLDHKLVEYIAQLPVSMKIKGMTEKYIIREAMKDKITNTVYRREKHPFISPPAVSSHKNPMQSLMQEVFYSDVLNDLPFYDKNKVLGVMEKLPQMPVPKQREVDNVLTHILSMCMLQKLFNPLTHN